MINIDRILGHNIYVDTSDPKVAEEVAQALIELKEIEAWYRQGTPLTKKGLWRRLVDWVKRV